MRVLQFVFILLFLGGLSSAQIPEMGVVVDTVVCADNSNQTYALYLPSNYDDTQAWPIIYFFEPAARGSLPVEKYQAVAEDLGLILACSNNSRNGSWELGLSAADAVFLDTQNKYNIDKSRAFTSGFSGGSRLALSIAVITKQIRGVIGIGAVQPPVPGYKMSQSSDFLYAGLVGNRDMNYQEHKRVSKELDEWGKKNILLVSEVGHQWAPVEDFRIAVLWLLSNSGVSLRGELHEALKHKLESFSDSISLSDINRTKYYMVEYLNSQPQQKLDKKLLRKEEKLFEKEVRLRLQFSDSLNRAIETPSNDHVRGWMIKEVKSHQQRLQKAKEIDDNLMYRRVLDHIRAISIETGFRLISSKQFERAKVCVDVWSAYEKNPKIKYWWYAKIAAQSLDKEECLSQLNQLVAAGFKDIDRLQNEKAFDFIKDHESFKMLLNKIESN